MVATWNIINNNLALLDRMSKGESVEQSLQRITGLSSR